MVNDKQHKAGHLSIRWMSLQIFAIGITITNIIPISILYFSKLYSSEPKLRKSLFLTAATAALAIIVTFVISYAFNLIYQAPDISPRNIVRKDGFGVDPIQRFIGFPSALANTILATEPRIFENETAIQNHHRIPYAFTFEGTQGLPSLKRHFAAAMLVAILIGGLMFICGPPVERVTGLALFGIIGYNWLFHSFWGDQLFLYSGHWLIPELILLSGFFRLPVIPDTMKLVLSIAFIVGVGVNNASILSFIITRLSS